MAMIDEVVLSHALTGIAAGATKAEVRADIEEQTNLRKTTIEELISQALTEALAQGIEREDVDDSWFL